MVFIYKTKTGYIISERPFGQTKKLGWEMLECHKTMETAKSRCDRYFPNYTLDTTPRKHYQINKRGKRESILTVNKSRHAANAQRLAMLGHKRYNDPWKTYRARAKNSQSKYSSWKDKPDVYFVIRPDGKSMRVWLPEGREHAVLPAGWRFGRPSWPFAKRRKRKKDTE